MQAFMEALTKVISFINSNILWGIPMIIAIMGTGILITVRTRALQVRKFGASISTTIVPTIKSAFSKNKSVHSDKSAKTVSQFEAFAAAISGTVGTGNIVGVVGAILAGGPGAVFWMWVSAFFGLVTNYSENVLGLYFRKKNADGTFSGGPMYYIRHGAKIKWLSYVFALCCSLAAVGMGMVQANSISGTLTNTISPSGENSDMIGLIIGLVVAAITALIVIGGIKRIGKVASVLTPFMALLFIVMALIVLGMNITAVPAAFALIFKSAFSLRSFGGGVFGYMIMMSMRYGFARGIFSNEAGLGSSVIAHSASDTKEPVKQGLWGIFEVFLDTFIICTLTALSLLSTAVASGKFDFTDITNNAQYDKNVLASFAFTENFGAFGEIVFAIILPLFAFTTILAWSYYGEKAVEYLFGEKIGTKCAVVFKVIYVLLLVVGAVSSSTLVWELDDMFNALMALPNLVALIILSGLIVKISKNYFDRKKGIDVEPMLSAYPELNEEFKKELDKESD